MPERSTQQGKAFGRFCIFLSRSCGIVSSIIVLVCGFVTLLPLPSLTGGLSGYGRCIAVGLIMIVTAVIMFFLEGAVLGNCVDRLSFLLVITKFMRHWYRAVLYMVLSVVPIALWCLSFSTLAGLFVTFLVGTINFILAIGHKGDHTDEYGRMYSAARLDDQEAASQSEEEVELHSKTSTI